MGEGYVEEYVGKEAFTFRMSRTTDFCLEFQEIQTDNRSDSTLL